MKFKIFKIGRLQTSKFRGGKLVALSDVGKVCHQGLPTYFEGFLPIKARGPHYCILVVSGNSYAYNFSELVPFTDIDIYKDALNLMRGKEEK